MLPSLQLPIIHAGKMPALRETFALRKTPALRRAANSRAFFLSDRTR